MHQRRQTHDGTSCRLPKLNRKEERRPSLPLVSIDQNQVHNCQRRTPTQSCSGELSLPYINLNKRQELTNPRVKFLTYVNQSTAELSPRTRRRCLTRSAVIEKDCSLPTMRQSNAPIRHSNPQMSQSHTLLTRDTSPPITGQEEDNKASQLLSMTKQTADSIVAMMKVLHKQLHPGDEYTADVEIDNSPSELHKQSCRSILKSLNRISQHTSHTTVRINPAGHTTNIYTYAAGENRGLTNDYNFSSEFNSVYAELKH